MTKRPSLFGKTEGEPTMAGVMERIGDGGGLRPSRGASMSLSTPIVSSQDGPRIMGKGLSNFGGKKAAPFGKGGKRKAKMNAAKAYVTGAKASKKA